MKKYKKTTKRLAKSAFALLAAALMLFSAYNIIIPDNVVCIKGEELPAFAGAAADTDSAAVSVSSGSGSLTYTAEYKLFGIFPIKNVTVTCASRPSLYVGGTAFGVRFKSDGIMIVGYSTEIAKESNPAYLAGLRPADVITKIDGVEMNSVGTLTEILDAGGGKTLTVTYERSDEENTVKLRPYFSKADGKYKTGLLVRDSGAGIGTVTYIMPETNFFGGLGHGICDGDTGALIPMERGTVTDVSVNGVVKGAPGAPGEIRGSFKSNKTGSLLENTSCGVFGIFTALPENHGELLPIALKHEVKSGEAYIICTLDSSGPQKYSVKIMDINRDASGSKCFSVKITDSKLIAKTGGIVQGMSGSPIIQDGKIVGAVTHVMVGDPTTGYGIFIENMLAQMGELAG